MHILCPNTSVSPDLTYSANTSCNELIWLTGHPIPKEHDLSNLEFLCESLPSGKLTDFTISDVGCPVASEAFVHVLRNNGIDNIEVFPASIRLTEQSEPVHGFYAINVLGIVDVIDQDNSIMDFENEDGNLAIYFIDKLVLKPECDSHALIYRPRGYRTRILIADRFKQLLDQGGVVGALLVTPEKWDGFNGEKP